MDEETIVASIAYLDDNPAKLLGGAWPSYGKPLSYEAAAALIQAMVQIEMAKHGIAADHPASELSSRVTLLESRMAVLTQTARRRALPVVQYVVSQPAKGTPAELPERSGAAKKPEESNNKRYNHLHRYRMFSGVVSIIWLLAAISAMASRLHPEPFFALFFSTFGLYVVFALKCRGL